jgi:hypothetical protein
VSTTKASINVEFVWMLFGEGSPFPQALRERNDADDLYGGYTDSNGFLRRVRGEIRSRIPYHNMSNGLFPGEALGQVHIDDADTLPQGHVDGDSPLVAPDKLCKHPTLHAGQAVPELPW